MKMGKRRSEQFLRFIMCEYIDTIYRDLRKTLLRLEKSWG